ncbi:metal-dependent phosphohydrolase [Brevundimonas sp. LM2]|uniref:phosphonate degradation HD-domain oxygenase n=1 Tax=Brevundimonas sp. LM2 TaxID=1938605 RepID=UPI000983EE1B|nr:phosphonate degradation HD-domain oxygenase [Brevundimonas sp. LM2]AQR61308.1 metal-dependent phosphohydrolase [Brevundimonas sp. LM2]
MTRPQNAETVVETIFALFDRSGGDHYGEAVTQREHALQTAHHARAAAEPDALVAAALLHDIGHLLQKQGQDAADRGIDAVHERIGAAWLAQGFGSDVTEPVRLHVEAKRYLAAREPGYADALSPASRQSLALQGGPMSEAEAEAFAAMPHFEPAVRLRRYDELAKVEGVTLAPLTAYRDLLLRLAAPG